MPQKRPNILFILTDQHSPHLTGYEGNSIIRTPNLDRLAAESAVFNQAYCQDPLCVPSRSSILTGQYCRTNGIYDNQDILPANGLTFPRHFSQHGYRTCLIGKGHFNGEQFQGYQERPYGDFYGQAHQPDPRRTPDRGENGLGEIPKQSGPSQIPQLLRQTEICSAEAAKWLQTHASSRPEQPFLLSLHYDKPHFPINPPAEFFNRYRDQVKLPERWFGDDRDEYLSKQVPLVQTNFKNEGYYHADKEDHLKTLAAYYGCVEWVDQNIGQVLEVLEYLGLADNTIVIYTSDHGEMGTEHGSWQKMVFFEASVRVPLLIRWPGNIKPQQTDLLTGLLDLFPTLCEAAGLEIPESCEGIHLLPSLSGSQTPERDHIFSETVLLKQPRMAGCMIRQGNWKFNYYLDESSELYDLAADPDETENLTANGNHAETVKELKEKVLDFWHPEEQLNRYNSTPRMPREKHFYPYSNQFMLGNGTIADAQP
jgi:choline-sulfatase